MELIRQEATRLGLDAPYLEDNLTLICNACWMAIDIRKGRDAVQLARKNKRKTLTDSFGMKREHGKLMPISHQPNQSGRLEGGAEADHEP